jgi:hypothetical protein
MCASLESLAYFIRECLVGHLSRLELCSVDACCLGFDRISWQPKTKVAGKWATPIRRAAQLCKHGRATGLVSGRSAPKRPDELTAKLLRSRKAHAKAFPRRHKAFYVRCFNNGLSCRADKRKFAVPSNERCTLNSAGKKDNL